MVVTARALMDAVTQFCDGKKISMTPGIAPGGYSQVYTQTLVAYTPKYILGTPNIVTAFMRDAGGGRPQLPLRCRGTERHWALIPHAISVAQKRLPKRVKFNA
jgi:hypothetical protein